MCKIIISSYYSNIIKNSNIISKPSRMIQFIFNSFLSLIILFLYCKVNNFEFINYDDYGLLTRNFYVNSGISWSNLIWSFTSLDKLQWVPLTWISHMLDFHLFGMNASGHHLVNVFFHLLNTLLILYFLFKTTNNYWKSYFVAAIFALHPLHVEPVVWISARKDVLSTLFFMITLLCYTNYIEKPGIKRYLLALGMYILGLMSKPMLVTLPFLLLLLDYWPLQRIEFACSDSCSFMTNKTKYIKLIYEKIPFIFMSCVFSIISYESQLKSNAISTIEDVNIISRFSNIVTSYVIYIWKMFWPAKLAVIYPLRTHIPSWEVVAASIFLLLVTFFSFFNAKKNRYLLVGWFWFLGTLIPVIGIIQIGPASMADKFSYIPLVGLFIMMAWGIPDILDRWNSERRGATVAILATIVLFVMFVRSWNYMVCWKNSITLYENALQVTENNYLAANNLGMALSQQGRHGEAMRYFYDSIRFNSRFELGYKNIGYSLMGRGDYLNAIYYFEKIIELKPDDKIAIATLNYCRKMIYMKPEVPPQGQIAE